jgi:hypothetical protein
MIRKVQQTPTTIVGASEETEPKATGETGQTRKGWQAPAKQPRAGVKAPSAASKEITYDWAGAPMAAAKNGGIGDTGLRVKALQESLGSDYYARAQVAAPGRDEVDGLYGFRTEAAVNQAQSDLAHAGVPSLGELGVADHRFAQTLTGYAKLPEEKKAALDPDLRKRLDGLVERSSKTANVSPAQATRAPAQTPATEQTAHQSALASLPEGHGLQVAPNGRSDGNGGFRFELKNGTDVVGELFVDAQSKVTRVDRPVELDATANLAAHSLEALKIPMTWTGKALQAVNQAIGGKLPEGPATVLKTLSQIDYEGAFSTKGLKAPWPSMFSIWGLERSPPQLGVYSQEKAPDGTTTSFVTISREDFAHDFRSKPTYQETLKKFNETYPDMRTAKVGDSVSVPFSYTGQGTTTGEYDALESFVGSYTMKATFRGIDEKTGKAKLDFSVENKSHWQSGTRIPKTWQDQGWPPYLVPNYERGTGIGGNITQRYIWSDVVDVSASRRA